MGSPRWFSRLMIAVVAFALCGGPELLQAQVAQPATLPSTTQQQQDNTSPAPATSDQATPEPTAQDQQPAANDQQQDQQPAANDQQQDQQPTSQDQNVGTTQQNAMPDPSKGPLQPAQTSTLPNAPSSSQPVPGQQPSQQQQPAQAPAGAAAAQAVKTAGGAASRPAGTAIAPAKQHQTRSLLIKISAIAAGAAALGTVYALSRSSPSTPPGAR